MTATQDDAIAELQRATAELRRERDVGLAREAALAEALAKRNSEFGERIEHQVATIDVLKAMSASPGDAQPVFDLIARQAANQCSVPTAAVATFDGTMMHLASQSGLGAAYVAQFPRPVGLDFSMGRAVLNRRVDQVEDITVDPGHSFAPVLGSWSVIAVPILRDGKALGAITIGRPAMGPFSASQVALLQTFAEQAVIAIGSTETYRALQERTAALAQRNSEYGEWIEQQSATIDVLKVMSSSPGNAQPVFELIVERARRFCAADQCTVALLDGDMLHLKAKAGMSEASARNYAAQFPRPVNTASMFGRAILAREAVQTPDVSADPEHFSRTRVGGPEFRAIVAVPMLRAGIPIGAIALGRRMPGVYSATQMELLQTFAEQAVIAISSAETYRALQNRTKDLQETLEYQTATSDVLKVISRSAFDLQPVLDTLVETAARLCDAEQALISQREGKLARLVANFGFPPEYETYTKALGPFPIDPDAPTAAQRALAEGRLVHIHDVAAVPGYWEVAIRLGKQRTTLGVPLLREGQPIGVILLARQRVEPFTDRQIELVSTFADQAVIAIENTRLLTEQREALEQQTATAEVLQVINASPGNLALVFDAMLEKAMRLCEAAFGELYTFDGENFTTGAHQGIPTAFADFRKRTPPADAPGSMIRRIRQGANVVHIADVKDDELYLIGEPTRVSLVDLGGARTVLTVALRKDETLLGFIVVYRQEVRLFSDRQVTLLQGFAAQAVIAMENARLINEQREALEQQTAMAEVLQIINASPGNLTPVFDAILEKARIVCGFAHGTLVVYDGDHFRTVATHGIPEPFAEALRGTRRSGTLLARLLQGDRIVHIPDLTAKQFVSDDRVYRAAIGAGGVRTVLFVPLRNERGLLGFLTANRREVRPFSEKEIGLMENFAAQAVIAMENARLLTEQQEALEQQTATAEVLQVINASPGDLAPVFDALLEKALRLCEATFGTLAIYDGEYFRTGAIRGAAPALEEVVRERRPPAPGGAYYKITQGADLVHIADVTDDEVYRSGNPFRLALVHQGGARTAIWVALRKDSTLLGLINIYRQEVRPFSEKQIALLRNFAAQAVIAMENARLLTEQREALEQQTATAEVLRVINTSPGDLGPVFDTMLEKALTLCGAEHGSLGTYDGDYFRAVASRGYPAAVLETLQGGFHGLENPVTRPLFDGARFVQIADLGEIDHPIPKTIAALGGFRTVLFVPLRKDGKLLGHISASRQEVRSFAAKEIALLENFAAQAVIAMENARLLDEIRQRQAELRVTFENMGDGVAMFDETQSLVAWNRKFQDILDLPDGVLAERLAFPDYIRYLTERGEYGEGADAEEQIRRLTGQAGEVRAYERTRPDGRVIEIRRNPVPSGGFVLIFSDISERKRNEAEIRAARDAAEEASRTIEAAYRDLKAAQANLIQAEKMASLGQLTAGIAHEIKNPLNFVNNFSALSTELIDELRDVLAPEPLGETARTEVDDLTALLKGNLEKVVQHGQRADGIVRSMLDHSRGSSGERRMVDLNALIDEALNLAYHGARAQDRSFNITLERDFDAGMARVEVNPQDITRVFLNLFANGFYAVTRRARDSGDAEFVPMLKVTTIDAGDAVEIRVRDNGAGIPADIKDKLFQPFFTTKPTGEGTGLGLSITYDIVTQQHGGSIAVDSEVGDYSEFTIRLPRIP